MNCYLVVIMDLNSLRIMCHNPELDYHVLVEKECNRYGYIQKQDYKVLYLNNLLLYDREILVRY